MITYSSFKLKTKDETLLKGHCWKPEKKTLNVIILIHGLGGHGLRYTEWAHKIAQNNCIVFSVDLRGHGQSEGLQGHANKISDYLLDLDALLDYIKKSAYKSSPLFLYGNSMGGLLAMLYLQNHPGIFKGAILASPWFALSYPPSNQRLKMLKWGALLFPKYRTKTGVSSKQLRSNNKEQQKAKEDPYVHRKISLGLFYQIMQLTEKLNSNTPKLKTPTLYIHGIKDPVTDAKATEHFVKAQNSNAELLLLKDALHEIHVEPESTLVFDTIFKWMKKHK